MFPPPFKFLFHSRFTFNKSKQKNHQFFFFFFPQREAPKLDDLEDRPDQDDEKPVVVVLKHGDLTQEEADEIQAEEKAKVNSNGK